MIQIRPAPTPLKPHERDLLRSTILKRRPDLLGLVESLGKAPLAADQRESLRHVLLEEFLERGLAGRDEPNDLGRRLDDLIGHLAHF